MKPENQNSKQSLLLFFNSSKDLTETSELQLRGKMANFPLALIKYNHSWKVTVSPEGLTKNRFESI